MRPPNPHAHGFPAASPPNTFTPTRQPSPPIPPSPNIRYGTDALRYSLVTGVTPGQDVPLSMEK